MGATLIAGRDWLARGVPVMAVTALAVAGAAGGGASARAAAAVSGTISTVAGGVGGPGRATNVPLADPCGVSVANGLLYIASNMTVRQVDSTDRLTTPVGTGAGGPLGDGGPATSASVGTCSTAVDPQGNLVLADPNRIRVVAAHNGTFYGQAMTAKDIYTVAGNGNAGYTGDGGPATAAELRIAAAVAVDGSGNLVIADLGNSVIRVAAKTTGTFYGQAMTAGDIYTVAGDGSVGFSGDGGPTTSAELSQPTQIALDASGNLVFADTGNNRVREVAG